MYNVQCIFLCLSYQILRHTYIVHSKSVKESKLCALNHEVHFENLYTRLTLDGRRQEGPEDEEPLALKYLLSYIGPKKSPTYNPTVGYEPYWPLGEWVFSTIPNKTTKAVSNELCGQNCPEMYMRYGVICGRDRNWEHKTFDNYCEMIKADCKLRADWLIAYRGECVEDLRTYPTKSQMMVTRMFMYISNILAEQSTKDILMDVDFFNKFMTTPKKS